MQKGLIPALEKLFQSAEHGFFLRHIRENMKLRFKGKAHKQMLWKFWQHQKLLDTLRKNINDLKTFNNEAQLWWSKIPLEHWSKTHFSGRALSDVLLNNMCEVLNAKITDARDKPIITLLEYIKEYLMRRIVNVLRVLDGCDGLLTPTTHWLFESINHSKSRCIVLWNGEDHYQVSDLSWF